MTPEEKKAKLAERNRIYRETNPEKVKADRRAYYAANREHISAEQKAYYEANKEEISLKQKALYAANSKARLIAKEEKEQTYRDAYLKVYPEKPEMDSYVPNFYVYYYLRHQDSETSTKGTPYYIGKGRAKRAWEKHAKGARRPVDVSNIVLIATDLYEDEALEMEISHITMWGRIDNGTGILRNRTDGGDGTSGFKNPGRAAPNKGKPSPRAGMPMTGKAAKGRTAWNKGLPNTWMKGVPRSQEIKDAIGKANKANLIGKAQTEQHKANTKAGITKWWAERKLAQQNLKD